jgi:hypothetical protein
VSKKTDYVVAGSDAGSKLDKGAATGRHHSGRGQLRRLLKPALGRDIRRSGNVIRRVNDEKVTKAVFPVAGLGSRFLPATKASPKEMMPIVDKPLIQYAVEEAVAAGMTDMVFITGRSKRAIEDHFDKAYELESELEPCVARRNAGIRPQPSAVPHQLHLHTSGGGARAGACGPVCRRWWATNLSRCCWPTICSTVSPRS